MIYEDNKDLNENVKLFDACLEGIIQEFTFEKQVHINNKVNKSPTNQTRNETGPA